MEILNDKRRKRVMNETLSVGLGLILFYVILNLLANNKKNKTWFYFFGISCGIIFLFFLGSIDIICFA